MEPGPVASLSKQKGGAVAHLGDRRENAEVPDRGGDEVVARL